MGSLCMGNALGYSSPAAHSLSTQSIAKDDDQPVTLTSNDIFWFSSIMTVGGAFGCILGGPLSQAVGRRKSLLLCSVGYVVSWLALSFAHSFNVLYAARLATGFFAGVNSLVVPFYVSEVSPAGNRGLYGGAVQLSITIGIFYSYLVGLYFDWSMIALLCAVPSVLMAPLVFHSLESPRWTIQVNRGSEAIKTLTQLRPSGARVDEECHSIEEVYNIRTPMAHVLMSLHLMFMQQFSGINSVIFYASQVFIDSGVQLSPSDCSALLAALQVAVTAAAVALLDVLGRRFMLIISSALCVLSLLLMGVAETWFQEATTQDDITFMEKVAPLFVALHVVGFSVGLGPAVWIAAIELVSDRGVGILAGIVVAFNWACAFAVTLFFEVLKDEFQQQGFNWFFCSTTAIGMLVLVLFLPETNGLTLEKIIMGETGGGGADNEPAEEVKEVRSKPKRKRDHHR